MELKSSSTTTTINDTWKLCTLGGFLGLFVLALFVTSNYPHTVEFTASRTSTFIAFFTSPSSSSTPPPPPAAEKAPAVVFASTNSNTTSVVVVTNTNSSSSSTRTAASSPQAGVDLSQSNHINDSTTASTSPPTSLPAANPSVSEEPQKVVPFVNTSQVGDVDRRSDQPGEGGKIISGKSKSLSSCNMYEGRWVYRPNVSPMYRVEECPFLEEKMSCRRNGRPDSDYEGWSWEAADCDIPLFNGKDMVERYRGKRVIIAGDSLNRNQWESLACLIFASIRDPSRVFVDAEGSQYKVLKAMDYGFTLEFYWSPFLVFLDEGNKSGRKVLNLDNLVPSSAQWRGAHVMLFNSGHWWGHRDVWDVFQYKGEIIQDMPKEVAYNHALQTWSNWLTANVDPTVTTVFFRSISPEHKGKYWCLNATAPISDDDESYINNYPKEMIAIAERQVAGVKQQQQKDTTPFPVTYLNITGLSGYRKDAHPAIYRYKAWRLKLKSVKVEMFADCSHWCLPGLPDTWNRLLYASLVFGDNNKKKVMMLGGTSSTSGNVTDGKSDDNNPTSGGDLLRIEEEERKS